VHIIAGAHAKVSVKQVVRLGAINRRPRLLKVAADERLLKRAKPLPFHLPCPKGCVAALSGMHVSFCPCLG